MFGNIAGFRNAVRAALPAQPVGGGVMSTGIGMSTAMSGARLIDPHVRPGVPPVPPPPVPPAPPVPPVPAVPPIPPVPPVPAAPPIPPVPPVPPVAPPVPPALPPIPPVPPVPPAPPEPAEPPHRRCLPNRRCRPHRRCRHRCRRCRPHRPCRHRSRPRHRCRPCRHRSSPHSPSPGSVSAVTVITSARRRARSAAGLDPAPDHLAGQLVLDQEHQALGAGQGRGGRGISGASRPAGSPSVLPPVASANTN